MKTIRLPCFDIVVRLDQSDDSGTITSNLHEGDTGSEDDSEYDAAIDGIESLILAHACAGVDIATWAYIEGIETAMGTVSNRL